MRRIDAIEGVLAAMPERLVVCYAGAACEELYARGDEDRFLYLLGSMFLASRVRPGLAFASAAHQLVPRAAPTILHLRVTAGDGPRRVVDLDPVRIRERARAYVAR